MEDMEKQVDSVVLELKEKLEGISDYIFEHPELGDEEYLSSQYLVNILLENGFKVQYPYLGVQTAFRAELGDDDGITIAFLAEYDALPYCGEEKKAAHTCGHNWIAGSTVGAALALSKIKEVFTGKVVVLGTPAEETIGRKIDLVNKGAFDDIDAVFQMHLCETTNLKAKALAMDSWGFEFKGKASHAAAYPHEGINALDAINLTFAGINALRQQLKPDVRIHGIITEGGEAPNIIPERCTCQFYVRSEKRSYLTQVSEKVKNCAKGAALMTGAKLDIKQFENSYDDLVLNSQLIELMHKNLKKAGFEYFSSEDELPGSTDIGNVSYKVPTMYGNVGIGDGKTKVHEVKFLEYANSAEAKTKMLMTIRAFAYSALELFNSSTLIKNVKEEFEKSRCQ